MVKETIRIKDAKDSIRAYVKKKYMYNSNFIDVDIRNTFSNKNVMVSMIFCAHGFNYYKVRDAMINKNMIGGKCPWCSKLEI